MKKILFIGATHGDESIGIEVLREIEQLYDREQYGYDWVVGNPAAFGANTRFTEADLNRSAPGSLDSSIYEKRRAAEIIELAANYDTVIDIHGTVADCGVVTIIPKPTAENLTLAKTLPIARNIIWYSLKSEISGPLVQHTSCPGLEIECGPKDSPKVKQELAKLIGDILLANRSESRLESIEQSYFEVYGPLLGEWRADIQDFQKTVVNDEVFYPFLSSQYEGITCYKMRTTSLDEAAL